MDDDTTPARLSAKPTWLISQVSARAHRLLTDRLAAAGARGYHYRLLAALAEFGPSSQASLGGTRGWTAATSWRRSANWRASSWSSGPWTRPTGAATSSR